MRQKNNVFPRLAGDANPIVDFMNWLVPTSQTVGNTGTGTNRVMKSTNSIGYTPFTGSASATPFLGFTGGLGGTNADINTGYTFPSVYRADANYVPFKGSLDSYTGVSPSGIDVSTANPNVAMGTPFTGAFGNNEAATGISTNPLGLENFSGAPQNSFFKGGFTQNATDMAAQGIDAGNFMSTTERLDARKAAHAASQPGMFGQMFESIGGIEGLAQGAQAIQGLFGVYQGMEALDMAQEKFDFQKDAWNKNFAMQKDAYDRQVEQVESRKAALSQNNERR